MWQRDPGLLAALLAQLLPLLRQATGQQASMPLVPDAALPALGGALGGIRLERMEGKSLDRLDPWADTVWKPVGSPLTAASLFAAAPTAACLIRRPG